MRMHSGSAAARRSAGTLAPIRAAALTIAFSRRWLLVTAPLVALLVVGCGGGGSASRAATTRHGRRSHPRPTVPARLRYRELYSLPAPLRDPAAVATGPARFALAGGLDAADSSSAEITLADRHAVRGRASLPGPQHDAQAAYVGGRVVVFGGGDVTEYDHILAFRPAGGPVTPVGALPRAASDVAVTQAGRTAYVVGGYDGSAWLDTILAWRPGSSAAVVGRLPVGLRYAAAAVAGNALLVIGGSTPAGASRAVFRFDLRTRRLRRLARLPQAVTHGSAAALDGAIYLVGGRGDSPDAQTADVWSIDPRTGRVRLAGRLPRPLSDAGVVGLRGGIVVAGGQSPTDTLAAVGELVPRR